jgi:hypothetical protein
MLISLTCKSDQSKYGHTFLLPPTISLKIPTSYGHSTKLPKEKSKGVWSDQPDFGDSGVGTETSNLGFGK